MIEKGYHDRRDLAKSLYKERIMLLSLNGSMKVKEQGLAAGGHWWHSPLCAG